jgi:hypothetical protein
VKFVVALFLLAFAIPSHSHVPRQPVSARLSGKVKLFRHRSSIAWACASSGVEALVYEAGLAVDADGAFRAYHPDDRRGLDTIAHAGHPGNWWALATDTGTPPTFPTSYFHR